MKIGLDFDGVISDAGKLKSDGAKRLYGVDIPPEKFKTEIVVGQGLLTSEQYKALQKQVYGTREIGLLMQEVDGAVDYTQRLISEGNDLRIVTSRGTLESEIAKKWMQKRGLNLPLINVGESVSKADACRGMDVYVDDDLDKLEPLVGVVPQRFLFSWGYNQHIEVPLSIAKRVDSWKSLYREIQNLSKLSPS